MLDGTALAPGGASIGGILGTAEVNFPAPPQGGASADPFPLGNGWIRTDFPARGSGARAGLRPLQGTGADERIAGAEDLLDGAEPPRRIAKPQVAVDWRAESVRRGIPNRSSAPVSYISAAIPRAKGWPPFVWAAVWTRTADEGDASSIVA